MIQVASGYKSTMQQDVGKAIDDLISMHPQSSNVRYRTERPEGEVSNISAQADQTVAA